MPARRALRCDAGRGSVAASTIATPVHAPVAQLDRVSASEAEGHWFESSQARHFQQARRRGLCPARRAPTVRVAAFSYGGATGDPRCGAASKAAGFAAG
jgi:hypothetical protein